MKYETENYITTFEVELDLTAHYLTDTRTEECHGFHTFEDINTNYVVNSIKIHIGNSCIDLTDRLTDVEKELLTENQNL